MNSPFDELKYKELLKGLEISEVWLSGLDKIQNRFDAEFYSKKNLFLEHVIKKSGYTTLSLLHCEIDCSAFYPGITQYYNYERIGIPFIRVNEIQDGFVRLTDSTAFLPENVIIDNSKTIALAYPDDIVIAKGGNTLAKVGILTNEYPKYAICRDVLLVRTKNLSFNQKYNIWAFLNSSFGYRMMIKTASQTGQPHLTVPNIAELKIPKWIENDTRFSDCYISATQLSQKSKVLYSQAEDLLLSELGLKDWQPNNNPVNIKQLKESFLESGRLDAEYYQSKYDALFAQLSKYKCDPIKDIVHIKKSVEPGSEAYQDEGIPFVRVSDVTKFGISAPSIFLSPKDFVLQELHPKKDTILLSKDGSIGIAYKVEKDLDCITSGALLHLSVFNKDYNPDYLTLVLNSIVVQMQAERDSSGAIIQHWKPSEIEQVIIPKLSKSIQDSISAKIQKSFALKAESKRLLDEAKRMVEKEIEEGRE